MATSYRLLRIARIALLVLAYLFGGLYLLLAGLVPLLAGGEPIPILPDGSTIPARLFGLLNVVLSAPMTFLFFYVPSGLIHLLLHLHARMAPGQGIGWIESSKHAPRG